ncbi:unnamed protein product [Protopolystoma xenopodis]|uniref:Uncharacterized protein n=1 Tax=Protopolystoma xenopodis TaxID=117903 RepID=A0A3S5AYC0_9PLAT|nr:unnamed protein product [Protopolystoma xenopodis]
METGCFCLVVEKQPSDAFRQKCSICLFLSTARSQNEQKDLFSVPNQNYIILLGARTCAWRYDQPSFLHFPINIINSLNISIRKSIISIVILTTSVPALRLHPSPHVIILLASPVSGSSCIIIFTSNKATYVSASVSKLASVSVSLPSLQYNHQHLIVLTSYYFSFYISKMSTVAKLSLSLVFKLLL